MAVRNVWRGEADWQSDSGGGGNEIIMATPTRVNLSRDGISVTIAVSAKADPDQKIGRGFVEQIDIKSEGLHLRISSSLVWQWLPFPSP